jgi:hypothetical protein
MGEGSLTQKDIDILLGEFDHRLPDKKIRK